MVREGGEEVGLGVDVALAEWRISEEGEDGGRARVKEIKKRVTRADKEWNGEGIVAVEGKIGRAHV